ncbi:MAG: methyltransferase domain-containing protein [Clostridia bacterium]|nr:methyltransferase domain-containing protein [Clostridia bacterium]
MENRKIINDILMCPVCGGRLLLTADGRSAACDGRGKRHLFDFASGGYINLYTSRAAGGDNAECIGARSAFLTKGYYEKISDAVNALLDKYAGARARVLDAGCGEGYYTNRMAALGNTVFGFDLSKNGVNIAAKAAKRASLPAFFGVASVFALPVLAGSMDAVTTIFAPCAEEEYARVLRENGILILAGAGKEHLIDLKKAIYDSAYENEGRRDLPAEKFELLEETSVTYDITLTSGTDVQNLFAMTPYFYRTSQKDKEKLRGISSLSTKIDVELFIYKKK